MAAGTSSSTINSSDVDVYVLFDLDVRTCDEFKYATTYIYTKDDKQIKKLTVPERCFHKFKIHGYYFIRNLYNTSDTFKLYKDSEIYQTEEFDLNKTIIESFVNPLTISIGEALNSPQKRRVSVRGFLVKAGDVITTPHSTRKHIKLSTYSTLEEAEMASEDTATIKLWGPHSEKDIPEMGNEIIIKNLEVSIYGGIKTLNSTLQTCFSDAAVNDTFFDTIKAVSWEPKHSTLLFVSNKRKFSIETDTLKRVLEPNTCKRLDVCVTNNGTKVLELRLQSKKDSTKDKQKK